MTEELLVELRNDLSEANDEELIALWRAVIAEMKGRGITLGN